MKRLAVHLLLVLFFSDFLAFSVFAANVTGTFTVRIHPYDPGWDNGDAASYDFDLCFYGSTGPICYQLEESVSECFLDVHSGVEYLQCTYTDCEMQGDINLACDHPFVNHPDDWDALYLENNTGTTWTIWNLWIQYKVNNSARWILHPADFPDNYDISAFGHSLANWVNDTRQRRVETALTTANDGIPTSWNTLTNTMTQEATFDIGQSGLQKYEGQSSPYQNGCDEFWAWFAYNESGGEGICNYWHTHHHNCPDGDTMGGWIVGYGWCPSAPDEVCITHDSSASPSYYVTEQYGLGPANGFLQHGQLYRLQWEPYRSDIEVDADGYACFKEVAYARKELFAMGTTGDCVRAEEGDMLLRRDTSPTHANSHAMMLLTEEGIEVDGQRLMAAVIDMNSSFVDVRYRDVLNGYKTEMYGTRYKYDVYIGKAPNNY
jgi:hypothetical protein